jgi:hypothetical protein
MWMYEGMAGGVSPWWHTIGAYSEDKRRFATPAPVFAWHRRNEPYLYDRSPAAAIGVVWSDSNHVFYGRDSIRERVLSPWRGMTQALVRARIPYVPIHADHVDREIGRLQTLILPNVAAMTDQQAASIRRFIDAGGHLFATGESSLYDAFGDRRPDYALADLFAAHWRPPTTAAVSSAPASRIRGRSTPEAMGATVDQLALIPVLAKQTYLRLLPELRAETAGPHNAAEPPVPAGATRHPALQGLDQTDIVYFGGVLSPLALDPGAQVLTTYIPPVPDFPVENAFMRVSHTDIPGLVVNTTARGSRVAFMPADLDRQYNVANLPDQADIIANTVRWTLGDRSPLSVDGPGLLDCNLYRQPGRMILHIANLSGATWRAPLEAFLPVGPLTVRVRLPADVPGRSARLLVEDQTASVSTADGWAQLTVPSIAAHEVVVIS